MRQWCLWQKFDEFDATRDFRKWAFGVARYQALAYLRDRVRDRHVFDDALVHRLAEDAAAADQRHEAQREALDQCLQKLPAAQRELVLAAYTKGTRMDELAARARADGDVALQAAAPHPASAAGMRAAHNRKGGTHMKRYWHEQIQRYVAGESTQEETIALQQALKDDAELRALYLDYLNLDVALGAAAEAEAMTGNGIGRICNTSKIIRLGDASLLALDRCHSGMCGFGRVVDAFQAS